MFNFDTSDIVNNYCEVKSPKIISIEQLRDYNEDHAWIATGVWNWGDSIQILQHILADKVREVGVLCSFMDDNILDFYAEQSFIKTIVDLNKYFAINSQETLMGLENRKSPLDRKEYDKRILKMTVDSLKFIKNDLSHLYVYRYFHTLDSPKTPIPVLSNIGDIRISSVSLRFAEDFRKGILRDYVLVQPYSIASCNKYGHWHGWLQLLDELPKCCPDILFVIVGKQDHLNALQLNDYPNILDLRGKTSTPQQLFALANEAKYTITTSNCLSHWMRLNRLRGSVFSCVSAEMSNYWTRVFGIPMENCNYYKLGSDVNEALYNIMNDLQLIFSN
jgi:hypothetical protein